MSWIDAYVGIPFAEQGRERATGLDCYGLVRMVLLERGGLQLPAFDTVPTMDGAAVREEIATQAALWIDVLAGAEKTFDVAIMRATFEARGKWYGANTHVGIIVGPGLLLHTEVATGSICLPIKSPLVCERIKTFKRHPQLA